jgi:hypothetical protein
MTEPPDEISLPPATLRAVWKILLGMADVKAPDSAFWSTLEIKEVADDYWSHVQYALPWAGDVERENKYRKTVIDGAIQIASRCVALIVHMEDTAPTNP